MAGGQHLIAWLAPQETLVLLTNEAKVHKHWKNLRQRSQSQTQLTPVDIPSGKSKAELRQIFDVTHGFRSLPMLPLLASAFLRVAKNIKMQDIMYGAFDARDENNQVPLFGGIGSRRWISFLKVVMLWSWRSCSRMPINCTGACKLMPCQAPENLR